MTSPLQLTFNNYQLTMKGQCPMINEKLLRNVNCKLKITATIKELI